MTPSCPGGRPTVSQILGVAYVAEVPSAPHGVGDASRSVDPATVRLCLRIVEQEVPCTFGDGADNCPSCRTLAQMRALLDGAP